MTAADGNKRPYKNDALITRLGGLCFFLSTIEYIIPKPLPFFRLGLANLPVLLAVDILPFPSYCLLILIKIFGQGLINGTFFSYIFLFSIAGTVSSALIMFFARKILRNSVSYIGLSVLGALVSNIIQLLLARLIIFGESTRVIAPAFIAAGIITGALLGFFANIFAGKSSWLKAFSVVPAADSEKDQKKPENKTVPGGWYSRPVFRLVTGAVCLLALLFSGNIYVRAGILAVSIVLQLADRSRIRWIPAIAVSAGVVFFNLLVPFGKIIAEPFGLPLTEGALMAGITKAVILQGMVFLSRWMLKTTLKLPGKFGRLISESYEEFGLLLNSEEKFDIKNPVSSIDRILNTGGERL
ncbi:Gx transporter family protein [Brucepastera parasyntrophica]|uniref:Gx transporter family protein n=1 Tax=Brucepastera parasyntrophica TaxID=2880008 RepID=UPI00210D41E5|nr:Gx transporter family protein [Brucepastera parasyntrophica]ULQ58809.1 Gx transporter family protein [Brucepastera parasyntrophica]